MKKRIYLILLLLPLVSCNDMFKNFLNEEPEDSRHETRISGKRKKTSSLPWYERVTSCSGLGADTLKHDFTGTGGLPVRLSRFDLEKHIGQRVTEG